MKFTVDKSKVTSSDAGPKVLVITIRDEFGKQTRQQTIKDIKVNVVYNKAPVKIAPVAAPAPGTATDATLATGDATTATTTAAVVNADGTVTPAGTAPIVNADGTVTTAPVVNADGTVTPAGTAPVVNADGTIAPATGTTRPGQPTTRPG